MKRYSMIIIEMQIKTTGRHHYTGIRIVKQKQPLSPKLTVANAVKEME